MEQLTLNMIPNGYTPTAHISQYDVGRHIRFNLQNINLAGNETVTLKIRKTNGELVTKTIENHTSYVEYVSEKADCDVSGKANCEIIIANGDVVIGSKNFILNIEADPYDGAGVVTETASGQIATFETNMADVLQEVKCSINPIQNGTPWIDSNEVNKEPYIKRNVAGTATRIGNHLYDKLVGGTVAWNQFVQNNEITGTGTGNANWNATNTNFSMIINHVYLLLFSGDIPNGSLFRLLDQTILLATAPKANSFLYKSENNTVNTTFIQHNIPQDAEYNYKRNIIDLTALFGSTIADYIYGLEQSTAGAGVAWFKALFPNDYYAYNAGESMSVKATAHVMKNASNNVIGNYPLDSNLELRGIPMLVNNRLEYDGDEYTSDGNVLRKYAEYIFTGSENWKFYSSEPAFWHCSPLITNGITGTQNICSNGVLLYVANNTQIRVFLRNNPQISESSNLNEIFANGTKMVYAGVSPTTETAQPFTNPQVCDENGTEEYTDSRAVAIPVGHETYQANICPITGFDELNIKQSGQDTSEIAKLIKLEFDDTVYLAEVSCLNGVWKLRLLGAEVDLGNLTPVKYTVTEGNLFRYGLEDIKAVATNYDVTQALCSHYPSVAYSSRANNTMSQAATLHRIDIIDNRYSDATAFKNAMSGVKLVYPLATPTEITLDETEQFEALIGINNVWHDGNGNTEVKYLYDA